MSRKMLLLVMTLLVGLSVAGAASAQADLIESNTAMNGLLANIQAASNGWATALQGYARSLLFSLGVIQLVLTFMPIIFKQADLGEIAGELVRTVLTVCFFLALIEYSADWSSAIINSFRQAGAEAAHLSSQQLMPGDMFAFAVDFSDRILDGGVSIFAPVTSFFVGLSAVIVLLCFTFIAALVFVTLVEAYVIINGSIILYGFGGLLWSRDYAIAPIKYAVAVGVKLMVISLLVGLVLTNTTEWAADFNTDKASVLTLTGLAFVCAYMTKTIPDLMSGMITGASFGGGNAIGGMAAAGFGTGAALGTAAVGAAATVATAGAAAPAAIGATGAVGAGTAGAAGGGGLAGALGSSMAGGVAAGAGSTAGAGAGAVGAATGGAGAATGGSTAGMAARAAGGAVAGGGQPASTTASGLKQVGQSAGGAGQQQSGQSTAVAASPSSSNLASTAKAVHAAADVGMKVAGAMAAISVPGMEGSQNVSLGAAPNLGHGSESGGDRGGNGDQATTESESGGNVIRPASPAENVASTAPAETPAPSPTPDTGRVVSLASLKVPGMAAPPPAPQGGAT